MKALNAMALDNSIKIVKIVNENLAGKIAPLYIKYYKRTTLDEVTFMHRWQLTNAHKNYHMLAAFHSHSEEPTGFLDFSLVPSIFWQPYLARFGNRIWLA